MTPAKAIEIVNRDYDPSGIFTTKEKEGIVNCLRRVLKLEQIIEKVEDNLKNVMPGCSVNAEDILNMIKNLRKEE